MEPIEFIPHPGGLGLGATPKPPEPKTNKIKKPGLHTYIHIYIPVLSTKQASRALHPALKIIKLKKIIID